ncbi:MAG: PQQ-binding-like beta-propeller repeat protein [Pyrinomonadaceae bacterium]
MKHLPARFRHLTAAALFSVAVAGATFLTPGTDAAGSNWPQWRGPDSQGVSPERGVPVEWSGTKNVKWKVPVEGRAHSSPIVWGKRDFLTTAVEGAKVPGAKAMTHKIDGKDWVHPDSVGADRRFTFKVLCFDRDTGKLLWEKVAFDGTPYDDYHRKSSYAASTPATDGKMVYAFFGAEGVYAYDFNGKLAWKQAVGKLGTVGMGTGTSPVLYENLVILQCDQEMGADSFIVALDKKTGKEAWRVPRKVQVSWSTPIIIRGKQRAELITSGTEAIISYDPATGKELWRGKGVESNAIPTPVTNGDVVIVAAGYPAKRAMAIRLGASGDVTDTPAIVWKQEKYTAYVPSPILYGDYVYMMTDRGILACIDAKTGKVVYEGGRVPVPATFMASPVAFDDKILLTSEDGDTYVIKAGPKHEVVRTNSLGEPVFASPAIADGMIFIRGEKNLYAISNGRG